MDKPEIKSWDMVQCSACLEYINIQATKCRYCGTINEKGLAHRRALDPSLRAQGQAKLAKEQSDWRHKMEELSRELHSIPYETRRKLRLAEWVLDHPASALVPPIVFAVLMGIAVAQTVGMLLPFEGGFNYLLRIPAGALALWLSFKFAFKSLDFVLGFSMEQLSGYKARLMESNERLQRLNQEMERRQRDKYEAIARQAHHSHHPHHHPHGHALPDADKGQEKPRVAPLPEFNSNPKP